MVGRLVALLVACTFLAAVRADAAPAPTALRLRILDCGAFHAVDAAPFYPGVAEHPERIELINRCYLVEHPAGTLIWDTGLPHTFFAQAMRAMLWVTTLGRSSVTLGPALDAQLDELGLTPADVTYVALSHVHFDHSGNANLFADSTWLVQKTERTWAFSKESQTMFTRRATYDALEHAKTLELDGDHDVFGDGRVVILSTPGHTPGHQSLYLDLPQTGPVVLSGDLYHTALNRTLQVPPAFNVDAAQTKVSMARVERLLVERKAQLWIQHDPTSGPAAPALVE